MDIIQAKLQECINKGSTNSIGRLSNLLHGNSSDDPDDDGNTDSKNMNVSMDTTDEVVTTPASSQSGKDPDKIPHKASITSNRKKKKRLVIDMAVGQTGAKLARKKITKMKKRGQIKNGQRIFKKSTVTVRKSR